MGVGMAPEAVGMIMEEKGNMMEMGILVVGGIPGDEGIRLLIQHCDCLLPRPPFSLVGLGKRINYLGLRVHDFCRLVCCAQTGAVSPSFLISYNNQALQLQLIWCVSFFYYFSSHTLIRRRQQKGKW